MPFGAALSFLLSLVVVLLPARLPAPDSRRGQSLTAVTTHSRHSPWLLGGIAVLVYLFLYAPIAVLTALSFNASRLSGSWEGFTLAWYLKAVTNRRCSPPCETACSWPSW